MAEVKDIVVTSKHLFCLESNRKDFIERKIELKDIYAISFSLASNEFIVHVNGEYDYLYLYPLPHFYALISF